MNTVEVGIKEMQRLSRGILHHPHSPWLLNPDRVGGGWWWWRHLLSHPWFIIKDRGQQCRVGVGQYTSSNQNQHLEVTGLTHEVILKAMCWECGC